MAEDGYPLNAFSLMLYPLSLQGDWQTEKYFEQIKSVIQKRQPIRKRYWDLIHFENDNIKQVHTNPPEVEGWVPFWHGFWQMEKVRSKEKIANDRTVHVKPQDDLLSEGDFERDIFLSIIRQFSDKYFVMVELGAGRGDWCLSAAGTITHQLISPCPSSYYCLAVEGEPTHCEWTREHFQKQIIAGDVVFGAITDRDGEIGFHVGNPADNYGQQIGGNYLVPAYTLDTLLAQYHLSHVSLLHVDVQGAEFEVIKGAMKSIIENKIEYMMIGTHMRNNIPLNDTLKSSTELLKYFELLIDIYPKSGANDIWYADGQRAAYLPVDGMQVFRRKI
jgi:FkbM family methyltransferase